MPLPLVAIIPALSGAVAVLVGADVYEVLKERLGKKIRELGPSILQTAIDDLGLELDASGGLTDETITAALNKTFLSGQDVQLASVFDRQKMLKGFEAVAFKKVAQNLGFAGVETPAGIRSALQEWLVLQVGEQLTAEAGELLDAANPKAALLAKIELGKVDKGSYNDISDFTAEGAANRARQKKYRQTHKRHWVLRG